MENKIEREKRDSDLFAIIAGIFCSISISVHVERFSLFASSLKGLEGQLSLIAIKSMIAVLLGIGAMASVAVMMFKGKKSVGIIIVLSISVLVKLAEFFICDLRSMGQIFNLFPEIAIIIYIAVCTQKKKVYSEKQLKQLIALPVILISLSFITSLIEYLVEIDKLDNMLYSIASMFYLIGNVFMFLWYSPFNVKEQELTDEEKKSGYVKLYKHILYLLFTFGIWELVWIYRTTDKLNQYFDDESRKRDPVKKLLLCMFIPFYYIYWTYKSAEMVDELSARQGRQDSIKTACVVLSIFVRFVSAIIMQNSLNCTISDMIRNKNDEESTLDPVEQIFGEDNSETIDEDSSELTDIDDEARQ